MAQDDEVATAIDQVSAAAESVEEQLPPAMREWGTTGLRRQGGQINEEYNPKLRGVRGVRTYTEMYDNDPIAGGMIFAITRILGRLPWEIQVNPDADCAEDEVAAAFIQSAFGDMDTPWSDVLEDILSMCQYGWAFLETNYKLRQGPTAEWAWQQSQFSDGLIGWRSFKIRAQDTMVQWLFDENGDLQGLTQQDPNGGGMKSIPIGKACLFRTTSFKDNPEGRSLLRSAYRPWFYKKRIEDFEGIGIERDLAGLPVATMPAAYFAPDAADDIIATRKVMEQLVSSIRNDTNGGVVMPVLYDANGNQTMSLSLMASAGTKQIDTNAVIMRKSNEMAMSILMDFMMLGTTNVGSFALGAAKIDLWTMAVESVASSISSTFNKFAIEKLLRWNGMDVRHPPQLVFGDVSQVDLAALGPFIQQMVAAGVLIPGAALDEYVRQAAHIPQEPSAVPYDPTFTADPAFADPQPANPTDLGLDDPGYPITPPPVAPPAMPPVGAPSGPAAS